MDIIQKIDAIMELFPDIPVRHSANKFDPDLSDEVVLLEDFSGVLITAEAVGARVTGLTVYVGEYEPAAHASLEEQMKKTIALLKRVITTLHNQIVKDRRAVGY